MPSTVNWDVKPDGVHLWIDGAYAATLPKDQVAAFISDAVNLLRPRPLLSFAGRDADEVERLKSVIAAECDKQGHLWSDDGIGDVCQACGAVRQSVEK